jgi:RNA chaperone Hfq
MAANLTDRLLETFQGTGAEIKISFHDGSTVTGKVVDFDSYTVVLSGNPDLLIYRHSILKLLSKAASDTRTVKTEKPTHARTSPKPQPRRPAREHKPPRSKPQPEPGNTHSEGGFSNPMADKMLEWLKSQKGGG